MLGLLGLFFTVHSGLTRQSFSDLYLAFFLDWLRSDLPVPVSLSLRYSEVVFS
jgi:hypothetical protein